MVVDASQIQSPEVGVRVRELCLPIECEFEDPPGRGGNDSPAELKVRALTIVDYAVQLLIQPAG
jgi:hypothetical protein